MRKVILLVAVIMLCFMSPVLAGSASYTVQKGDTLYQIAKNEEVSLEKLISYNPQIENPHWIFPGDKVLLPEEIDREDVESVQAATLGESEDVRSNRTKNNLPHVSDSEKELMARIVYAEAKGESYEGKVAVAHVILNRVDDDDFPDTITEVIYQPRQFQPVSNGAYRQQPDEDSRQAVEEALHNRGDNKGSLYFYNPQIATSSWIFSRQTVKTVGNHVFAR